MFTSVSTTVLRFYNCVSYEEGFSDGSTETIRVLEADHDISCDSPSYKGAWSTYALAMLFVYPAGIPLSYCLLLFRYRKQLDPDVDETWLGKKKKTKTPGAQVIAQSIATKSKIQKWQKMESGF